jgi:tRNA(Ile)-lysidine synthase
MSSAEADSFLRTNGLEAGLKARTTRTSLLSATSEGLDVFQSAECGPEGPLNRDSCQPGACIVRPLLGVTREEVEKYLAALGQTWREDESNLDHRFARNRLRHELLPLLEREYNPNIRQVLSDAAELSRAEEEYWQALVERELQDRMAAQRLRLMNFRALPLALQRRLLRRFVETANLALDFEHVEKLLRCALGELPKAELPGGWLAVRQGGCLELLAPQVEPPFSSYQYTLPVPGEVHIAEIGLTVRCIPVPQEFAKEEPPGSLLCTELLGPELIVRNWRPGDRFWPVHSKSEEKLKRLFSEKHVPAGQRPRWPVVLKGEQIVWVRGFPVSRAFAWSGSGDAVRIELLVST